MYNFVYLLFSLFLARKIISNKKKIIKYFVFRHFIGNLEALLTSFDYS